MGCSVKLIACNFHGLFVMKKIGNIWKKIRELIHFLMQFVKKISCIRVGPEH